VIALDLRGHGESEKPNFGLKIHRLAQELREALVAANAPDVTLLGHSMGCSVIWAYWELFGADRLGKIVLADEPPMLTSNPAWTPNEREAAGAILTPASLWETANALAGPDGEANTRAFIGNAVTRKLSGGCEGMDDPVQFAHGPQGRRNAAAQSRNSGLARHHSAHHDPHSRDCGASKLHTMEVNRMDCEADTGRATGDL
jgi:pimeloyl-ACP methyl ester carboxylesterase